MATPRQTVADQLRADNPGFKVYAFPYFPAQVGADPVISVWRTDVGTSPDSPNLLRHALQLQAMVGPTLEEKAEAAGDDLLDAVLLSLQRLDSVAGITAERTVFGDEERGTFQGWLVKFHAESANVYKQTVLTEGS